MEGWLTTCPQESLLVKETCMEKGDDGDDDDDNRDHQDLTP